MFGVGSTQLIVLGLVAILLFGNRLPGTMRALGQSLTEFRRGMNAPDEPSEEPVA
ncbi:MAG: twin-arginine translocase TatA/TatE family subunit [Planctomycetota bacterium]|nr:MAG: twin-arginine translocase TatA/TatE family subunit [Planctomycetota bacterium]REJ96144.1 MAG: twin-arginine translocase TatA/TatE family subunit [Planctomycetota bacterium]REK22731.1 MAG: twin-arginine translocase TatA/TatE family subunit [Planctomycetota bacterium]REK33849.1 MAG: twin-arginine translocase TatA/TatE family subunit [Planctomycetota bacterium]